MENPFAFHSILSLRAYVNGCAKIFFAFRKNFLHVYERYVYGKTVPCVYECTVICKTGRLKSDIESLEEKALAKFFCVAQQQFLKQGRAGLRTPNFIKTINPQPRIKVFVRMHETFCETFAQAASAKTKARTKQSVPAKRRFAAKL